ncbi:MAG TPA: AAA family ATPase [Alphaproteobacteria bacterium]|nr:AAA family ATPase [Alphaproteobacteria bacterium]
MAMLTCPNCGFGNPDTARFCSNCGNQLDLPRAIEGERRFATVLFADVARSTAIAEQLDPEDWALIMNGAFGFMNAAVSRYGGTVSRLMGDAVLALFGAPVAHEDDAERAVRAGLEIQQAGMAYARTVKHQHGFDFDLRVGINTGTAVLAFVGDAIKTEYTAMGDAANVAARLQSAAEPGTVLISAETYRLVHGVFDVRPRGPIDIRGKQTAVESYEVIGVRAQPGSTRGLEGLTSPLVGRDRELALLRERLDDLERGIGSVVAVVGEAGLGKSRLTAELRKLHEAKPAGSASGWLETRAISYGQSIPYFPWRAVGRQIIGASEMDEAAAVRDKIGAWMQRLGLRAEDRVFYETMLAVEDESSRLAIAQMSGEKVVNGVASAVVNAFKSAIHAPEGMRPRVLLIDDLHWSDSATLELLAQVATLAAFEPLMIVCLLRPDRRAPSWPLLDRLQASLGASFARIDLEPLSSEASAELLGNLLMIKDLPASIRSQILERSEGNPFYLEEVLRSLIDEGRIVREAGGWRATSDIVDATIPETLAGVLSARIDRLPDATKRVAQTAAVIGRVFQHRVLESVLAGAPPAERIDHVEPHIATLSYEQLVRERARDPEREYIFKHALTCEAAYSLLLKSRRRDLHARCGLALETLFADRRDEYAAMLAHHFAAAEDLERAVGYATQAADRAAQLFALREEMQHREFILDAVERLSGSTAAMKIDAILNWVRVNHFLNRYDGVIQRLEQAISIARETSDKPRLASALSWLATIHMVTGFPSRGAAAIEEAQQLALELNDERLLLLPLFMGTFALVDRDPAAGARQLQDLIDLARRYSFPEVQSHAMAYRAVALARTGDFAAARRQIEDALDFAPHAGSPVKEADVHIGVAAAYYDMNEFEKAEEHARIGAEQALAANGLECACAGYFELGRAKLRSQQLDDALATFSRSLGYGHEAGFHGYINVIRGNAAIAEFEKGVTEALDKLRMAIADAERQNDDYNVAALSVELAAALVRLRRYKEAGPLVERSLAFFRERNMRPYIAKTLTVAGNLYEGLEMPAEADAARREASALREMIFTELPSRLDGTPSELQA